MRRELSIEPGAVFQERYEILHKISEGGFGTVFKARQLTTGQTVAIKCLHRQGRSEDEHNKLLARFRREMQLCAQLHHPNIVRLIDSDSVGELLYTVFEFVPGSTLAQILAAEGSLYAQEASYLMSQVLDALSCAHSLGIVHRDLKPSNIMVVETGARRNALVLDFGISALTQPSRQDDYASLTEPTDRMGTPAYSAPEQLRGMDVSERSDLYSWGLVFIECLIGERVVPGRSIAEVIHEQMGDAPIPIPPMLQGHPLGEVLQLATAKNPAQRICDARALLRRLEVLDLSQLGRADMPTGRMTVRAGSGVPEHRPGGAAGDATPDPAGGRAMGLSGDMDSSRAHGSPGSQSTDPRASMMRSGSRRTGTRDLSVSRSGGLGPRRDERRQITALSYVLWVTPTAALELDIEEQADLLAEAQMCCTELLELAGGYLADVHGHRGLAFFGYPKAHDDDARRAVDSGLILIERVPELVAKSATASVTVQVGLHTGLVVARGGASEVFGEAPTLATGLAELAPPASLLASIETKRLVHKYFGFSTALTQKLGGLATPIETFVVTRLPPTLEPGVAGEETRLIGRNEELALLRRAWARTQGGNGQLVLVSGEAGIGKSRLIREMKRLIAGEPHAWFETRCLPEGRNSALRPVAELVDRILDFHADESSPDKLARLESILLQHAIEPADVLPLLASLIEVPEADTLELRFVPQRKALTMHAVLTLVTEIARKTPLLLIFEDLHWADPTTLELLAHLADEAAMSPLCVLTSARPDFTPPWRSADMTLIQLGRLPYGSIHEIVANVTGGKPLPEDVLEHVEGRTDGVPLFIEELTRAIIESPAIVDAGDRYELTGTIADLSIPATLRDSLMARLDRLDSAQECVHVAAVLGREFTYTELAAVCELPEAELGAAIDELIGAELLYRRRRLRSEMFSFKHVLIQETAYDSLPRRVRRDYHGRIARAYAGVLADIGKSRPELLAHHYACAEEYETAVEYALMAGRAALGRSACAEAVAFSEQGLEWVPQIPDERRRAEAELAFSSIITSAYMASYGYDSPGFRARMQRAWELIDQVGDSPHTLVPLWGLWSYHFTRAQHDQARLFAERCAEQAMRTGDTGQHLVACVLLGMTSFYAGRFGAARGHLERALEWFDARAHNDHILSFGYDSLSMAHSYLGLTFWMLGFADRAVFHAAQASDRADELAHPVNTALVVFLNSKRNCYQGERETVAGAARRILAVADQNNLTRWQNIGTLLMSWAMHDPAAGMLTMQRSQYRLRETFWKASLAESLAACGDIDGGLALLDQALVAADETNERSHVAIIHRLRGTLLLGRDPADEGAAAAFRRAIAVARAQQARMPELQAATALARLMARHGDMADARALLAPVLAHFTEGTDSPPVSEARALLAEL